MRGLDDLIFSLAMLKKVGNSSLCYEIFSKSPGRKGIDLKSHFEGTGVYDILARFSP